MQAEWEFLNTLLRDNMMHLKCSALADNFHSAYGIFHHSANAGP
jgi:hypothetical protein